MIGRVGVDGWMLELADFTSGIYWLGIGVGFEEGWHRQYVSNIGGGLNEGWCRQCRSDARGGVGMEQIDVSVDG